MSVIALYRVELVNASCSELDLDKLQQEVTREKGYFDSRYQIGFVAGNRMIKEYTPIWPVMIGLLIVFGVIGLFGFLLRDISSFVGASVVPFFGSALRVFDMLSHEILSWLPSLVNISVVHGVLGAILFIASGLLVYFGLLKSVFRKFLVFDYETGLVHIPSLFGRRYDVIRFEDAIFLLRFSRMLTMDQLLVPKSVRQGVKLDLVRPNDACSTRSHYFNMTVTASRCVGLRRFKGKEYLCSILHFMHSDDRTLFRSTNILEADKRYRRYDPNKLATEPNWVREGLEDDHILWRRPTEEDIQIYHDELVKRREKRQAIAQAKAEVEARQQAKDNMTPDEVAAKARERHQRRHKGQGFVV